jgi:N-methylhydantoinase A
MATRLGVDVGGTFTDLVLFEEDSDRLTLAKTPTTPENQSLGVLNGIAKVSRAAGVPATSIDQIMHGTTIATNALLERKGVKCALVSTEGFRDVLEIGRQDRPRLYEFAVRRPKVLVPRHLRYEVRERTLHTGEILLDLDIPEAEAVAAAIASEGVTAVAVCLLHSYANPTHERLVGEILSKHLPQGSISLSSDILREFKEYERTSTTVINAYVGPPVKGYLSDLQAGLLSAGIESSLLVMKSNGGLMSAGHASDRGVQTILSGPAAGALGSVQIATRALAANFIAIDMGGTSFDICLAQQGSVRYTRDSEIGGLPIKVPMIDIHTIGAGGGSIAWIDAGGALRVGPRSAGAKPGPACYMHGGSEATVTDANLVLGRLNPESSLGGEIRLDPDQARIAISKSIAMPLGMSVEQAAEGIIDVVNATMAKGIRYVSVERGHDPRDFVLVAYGGGGPSHAAELADNLLIPRVIVPPSPGVTSAIGLLMADFRYDNSSTFLRRLSLADIDDLAEGFLSLEEAGLRQMQAEGVPPGDTYFVRTADMRYLGQGYELEVPIPAGHLEPTHLAAVIEQFHQQHERVYGYSNRTDPTELVCLRVATVGRLRKPALRRHEPGNGNKHDPRQAQTAVRRVYIRGEWLKTPFFDRVMLQPGDKIEGPAVVEQTDSTTLLLPGQSATVDAYMNLVIRIVSS